MLKDLMTNELHQKELCSMLIMYIVPFDQIHLHIVLIGINTSKQA